MGHGFRTDKSRSLSKKRLVMVALFVGIGVFTPQVIIGVAAVATIYGLLGQADKGIGQNIGNIFQTLWNYGVDFINAVWKQVITNPLQFITGGNN